MIANTLAGEGLRDGMVIGKYGLDPAYYAELTEAAFSLSIGDTSDVIEIITGSNNGYYIIYRVDKSDAHFDKCYDEIEASYILNLIGKDVFNAAESLKGNVARTDAFNDLNRAEISMD